MCGVAGAINVEHASEYVRMMLHALQNRGQQAAGIISFDGTDCFEYHTKGTVANDFTTEVIDNLRGNLAIGHNRYATAANSDGPKNMQPFLLHTNQPMAIAHNGNFTNVSQIEDTVLNGTPFFSQSDTERFFRLILRNNKDTTLEESIIDALNSMRGSCSAIFTLPNRLIAIRDSSGNRPLFWGKCGDGFVVASETSALDAVGAFVWNEVKPGTIITFTEKGEYWESRTFGGKTLRLCPFELVYFAQITSAIYGVNVNAFRVDLGRTLSEEHQVDTDIIVGIPDSGTLAGLGFAEKNTNGTYNNSALIRRHNTGRTFIRSAQAKRERGVDEKFGFNTAELSKKRVALVDDSLIRGTTSTRITKAVRERGATEVHWRIPSPQVTGPCHYGIATKDGELLANGRSNKEMAEIIGADSVEFLSMEKFQQVISDHGISPEDCCFACMDGNYWDL